MKLSEILRAGKQRIETQGWCQGDDEAIFGKSGKCCAATALTPFCNVFSGAKAAELLIKFIDGPNISTWNDAPERTIEDVYAAYDKAIAAAEAQESPS